MNSLKLEACKQNTLPKYLYESNKGNILNDIKKTKSIGKLIGEILKKKNKLLRQPLTVYEIIKLYYLFGRRKKNEDPVALIPILVPLHLSSNEGKIRELGKELRKYMTTLNKNPDEYKKYINREIDTNKKECEIITKFTEQKGLEYSNFENQLISLRFISPNGINSRLIDIFNRAVVNNDIPFVVYDTYYKILREMNIDDIKSQIIGKTNNNVNTINFFLKAGNQYISCVMTIEEKSVVIDVLFSKYKLLNLLSKATKDSTSAASGTEFRASFTRSSGTSRTSVPLKGSDKFGYGKKIEENLRKSVDNLSRMFKDTFILDEQKVVWKENVFLLTYNNVNDFVNPYIFSDIVMIDKVISNYLIIDESSQLTKRKLNVKLKNNNSVLFTIQNFIEKGVRGSSKRYLLDVKVKIKQDNLDIDRYGDMLTECINTINKSIAYYFEKKDQIIALYKSVIGSDKYWETIINMKEKKVEIPKIYFLSKCEKKRQPKYIPSVEGLKKESYMKFQNYYFACNNKTYPYIDFVKDKTKKINEKIPCCFKKLKTTTTKKTELEKPVLTNYRQLQNTETGVLPNKLNNLFNTLYNKKNHSFVRRGTVGGLNTFINSVYISISTNEEKLKNLENKHDFLKDLQLPASLEVLYRTGNKNVYNKKYEEYINNKINIIRNKNFSEDKFVASCKQELYDLSYDEIRDNINNLTTYFDPSLYINMISLVFECNIIICSKDDIRIPRHLNHYYQNNRKYEDYVIIHENGNITELIGFWSEDSGNAQYLFNKNDDFIKILKKYTEERRKTYTIRSSEATSLQIIKEIDCPLLYNSDLNFTHQVIDSFGKCRGLFFNLKTDNNIAERSSARIVDSPVEGLFITSPIQPLLLPTKELDTFNEISSKNLDIILKKLKLKATKVEWCYEFKSGNVQICLPIGNLTSKSELESFRKFKMLATNIIRATKYLFSKRIADSSNPLGSTAKEINDFFENKFEIISDFTYDFKKVYKKYSDLISSSSGFMKDDKIILKDKIEKKSILFYIKREYEFNKTSLLEFHKKDEIEKMFLESTDFEQDKSYIVLSKEILPSYLYPTTNILQKKLSQDLEKALPYFLQINVNNNYYIILIKSRKEDKIVDNNFVILSYSSSSNVKVYKFEKNQYNRTYVLSDKYKTYLGYKDSENNSIIFNVDILKL